MTWTVLRAWASPTWIFWPPTMTDPRTETRRVTTRGSGRRGGWAVPGRAPRSRGRASGGTGQATVRTRTPPARTWATGPSSRSVTRCPASGSPALITWSPRLTLPEAFTVRSTSITSPAAGGSGGGPAGRAPAAARRARSRASSRDGRVLIRWPSSRTWTWASPAQSRTVRPVIAGPSQICCPAIQRFPDGGTTRSSSTALPCPLAAGVLRGRGSRPVTGHGISGGDGRRRLPGQLGGYPQADRVTGGRGEPGGGEGHGQGLVRPRGVVVLAPGVHRGLGVLDAGERAVDVEQLQLQCLVQPLDLPGRRRRAGLGQPLGDAVLPADPLEQHLSRAGPAEPAGELLAVVGEHLGGDPVLGHRGGERQADRPGGGPHDDGGDDAEPGVVVDPGDDLALAAVGQEQARGHVHLPQLHRRRALPAAVLVPAPAPRHRLDQVVADQDPVNRRPGDTRVTPALQLEDQAARTPAAVRGAQVADHRLDLGADPPRVRLRRVRAVSQPVESALAVTGHPAVHRLAGHPEPLGDLSDRGAVKDLKHCLVPLLDHVQLPKHCGSVAHQVKPRCRTSSGA